MGEFFDVAIVGGGIAGASAGFELARTGARVLILERESQPGYHSTGRSAALFTELYGPPVIRALTGASRATLEAPDQLADHALLSHRGVLHVAQPGQMAQMQQFLDAMGAAVVAESVEAACARMPVLKAGQIAAAAWEHDAHDIDVAALHQGYLRGIKAGGGAVRTGAELLVALRRDGVWLLDSTAGSAQAPVLINAAGAWADEVGRLVNARAVGLVPKRRTVVVYEPDGVTVDPRWPFLTDVAERFYVKPESGRLLASPADATPVRPHDVQPEEFDMAVALDRVERVAALPPRRVVARWAGLRSFVGDGVPVVGFDSEIEGFFWLAGQGGYGIQTSPAMGRLTASLIGGYGVPGDIAARGVTAAALSPDRTWDYAA
jgi:D-arginine dehydrogenase